MPTCGSINNLGNIYLSMGDAALALKTHQDCAALFPDENAAPKYILRTNKLNRGRVLTILGKFEEATKLIEEADALNKDWLIAIQ